MRCVTSALLLISISVSANEQTQEAPGFHALQAAGFSQESLSHWSLEPEDISRINELVSIEKAFSDVSRLTPFEILGKFATTDSERAYYANLYVEEMVRHQKRSLEWSVAVASVIKSNDYRDALMEGGVSDYLASIGYNGKVDGADAVQSPIVAEPKRIHAFVSTSECNSCSVAFLHALEKVNAGRFAGVDVVFIGMKTEDREAAVQWALENNIPPEMVNSKKVTLNFESDDWERERADRQAPLLINSQTGQEIES